jgi:diketogulonate reductase-like aldo/keto reductase
VYGNEAEVGRAVAAFEAAHAGERVFITTKASARE